MVQIQNLKFGFGTLTYRGRVEAIPASVVKQGNVTTHNAAQPGSPAYFEVAFQIQGHVEEDGVSEFHIFNLTVPLIDKPADSSYSEIEAEAAKQLAPMLRLFADEIERQVAETDAPAEVVD